ncbi:galactose mutarotase [Pikeienuella piscinae]|uniref:Galactose mutarotase n=1 Tax=Pikeienuella piscinae TaxID=2748098 RepID=A0A7M3T5N4_9RHOB|nr:aldose epimerase family protein [Pikeienuella piscinae]QIE57315.1 galactose mutarotase [Pikeienuella piscinae]
MSVRPFGVTAKGERVEEVRIAGGGLSAAFLTWGCVTREIRLDGLGRSLVLGLADIGEYERHGQQHVGAIAGRCANRIAGGRFVIDGVEYQAARNVGGMTTLHGGDGGFGRSLWRLVDHGADHARFAIRHEDGEEGFPGAIEAECAYRLAEGGLNIELTARAEAPTLCNLAQHNYYNLSGAARIDEHELWLAAETLTPLGPEMTPTGVVEPAEGGRDFRLKRRVGAARIDVNYILAEAPRAAPVLAARLSAGGVEMALETTAPGLQLYTADGLDPPAGGAEGRPLGRRAGLCLEPQLWPDAPRHAHFPGAILRPGEVWRQLTRLRFSAR